MIQTTIVGFGDSLTFGYGVSQRTTYTRRLEAFLPQCYPSVNWKIQNSGINGDTTREALQRLQKDVLRYHPNIVFILFGSNDSSFLEGQYRTPYEYEKNLCSIVEQIHKHNNHTGLHHCQPIVVLITPPPVIDTDFYPFTTTERVEKYGEIVKKIAKQYHCPIIDFFKVLQEFSQTDTFYSFFQEDGIHLSEQGYDHLYDCIFSMMTRLVDRNGILKEDLCF